MYGTKPMHVISLICMYFEIYLYPEELHKCEFHWPFDSAARSAAQVESVFSACLDELKLSAKL